MRVCLNIAITEMVIKRFHNDTLNHGEVCEPLDNGGGGSGSISSGGTYDWDEEFQGVILSSFYWGLVCIYDR